MRRSAAAARKASSRPDASRVSFTRAADTPAPRSMDEVTAERVGRNEAVFRRVNEEIEQVNRAFATLTQTMEVVCECGNIECTERFLMTMPDYERLRADPTHFAVRPGHEIQQVEHVIEENDAYVVVRKDPGLPERIAEETNPRR